MTISNTTRRTSVVGNNTIGQEVTIPYEYTADSEISVITRLIATGAETILTKDVDYTLSTGLVTTLKAYAETYQIHVVRNTLLTQTTDLEQGGAFNAETVEAQLDKATMQAIDNADALNRSLKAPVTDAATLDMELPNSTERASSFLFFDANGEPTAVNALTAGDLAISAFGETLVAQVSAEDARTTLGLSTSDGLGNLGVTAFAKTILDDANAAATRTTLELGDVALLTKSADGTLADNLDTLIPTQKAVKTYVDGATAGVLSMSYSITGELVTGTTLMATGTGIPQITEGRQMLSLAVTPSDALNLLKIDVTLFFSTNTVNRTVTAALFQDSGANAIAVGAIREYYLTPYIKQITFSHVMAAGTTDETTFTVRMGADASAACTVYLNGNPGRFYGGKLASSIIITEMGV